MIFEGFKIHAVPLLDEAYCNNKRCKRKDKLKEVSNGFLSSALFCPACESVYIVKLERVNKVPKDFLQQCKDEVELERRKSLTIEEFSQEVETRKRKK
jgi:hypothetical protein